MIYLEPADNDSRNRTNRVQGGMIKHMRVHKTAAKSEETKDRSGPSCGRIPQLHDGDELILSPHLCIEDQSGLWVVDLFVLLVLFLLAVQKWKATREFPAIAWAECLLARGEFTGSLNLVGDLASACASDIMSFQAACFSYEWGTSALLACPLSSFRTRL